MADIQYAIHIAAAMEAIYPRLATAKGFGESPLSERLG
jgi:hypothetical protein